MSSLIALLFSSDQRGARIRVSCQTRVRAAHLEAAENAIDPIKSSGRRREAQIWRVKTFSRFEMPTGRLSLRFCGSFCGQNARRCARPQNALATELFGRS